MCRAQHFHGGVLRKEHLLLLVPSLTAFATSFGAYVVAATLPSYSRETGAGLIVIGFLIALYDIGEIFRLGFLRDSASKGERRPPSE